MFSDIFLKNFFSQTHLNKFIENRDFFRKNRTFFETFFCRFFIGITQGGLPDVTYEVIAKLDAPFYGKILE